MKTFNAQRGLILMALAFAGMAAMIACSTGRPRNNPSLPAKEKAVMSQYSSKLSPGTKRHLAELKPEENPEVAVMLRVRDGLTPDRQSQIEALGGKVVSLIGDVVTANIPSRALLKLAELDFIVYVEISRPLRPMSEHDESIQ
jgi:hypothetical protein